MIRKNTRLGRLVAFICFAMFMSVFPVKAKIYLDEDKLIDVDTNEVINVEDAENQNTDITAHDENNNELNRETEETSSDSNVSPEEQTELEENRKAYEAYKEKLLSIFGTQKSYINKRLSDLRKELQENTDTYSKKSEDIEEIHEKIEPLQTKILSLKNQIDLMNGEIYLTQIKIKHAKRQIEKKESQIVALVHDIESEALKLKDSREKLERYVLFLYKEQLQFIQASSKKVSLMKLILSRDTVGETYLKMSYFRSISKQIENMMVRYEQIKQNLLDKERLIGDNKDKIVKLKAMLEKEQNNLSEQSKSKKNLLAATEGEEKKYQALLQQTKKEQEESAQEIEKLENNITFFTEKLDEFSKKEKNIELLAQSEYPDNFLEETLEKEYTDFFESANDAPLRWPITAENGISAYFKDSTYPFTNQIGQHMGIDVPTPMGTPIHAPRAAVVGKIKAPVDSSYAYLILIHGDNIMTVYGHVSEVMVKEGDLVQEGDIVGFTGGQIGSNGAGWATTGAHLHFEVYKNGEHVNPLLYLPLSELDEEFIPVELRNGNE